MRLDLRIALVVLLCSGRAAAATYTGVAEPFAWVDSAAHTDVVWTGASGGPGAACTGSSTPTEDDLSELLPIGFTFWFGAVAYTQVRVMSNGRIQFNNTYCHAGTQSAGPPPAYFDPYPSTNLVRTIRVYGTDISPAAGGTVKYTTTGTAPDRQFIVTWSNVEERNQGGSAFHLQIVLDEDQSFVLRYGAITNPSGGKAEIGWEIDTTDFEDRVFTSIGALANTAQRYSVPSPVADYRFDESSWSGTTGEIADASGGSNAGAALGSATSTASGRLCRGGFFAANTTGSAIAAATTPVAVPAAGTITLWARIDAAWNNGTAATLIDASRNFGATTADRAFQLQKDGTGRLGFRLTNNTATVVAATSTARTFASGQWHHVAIAWSFAAGRMTVYLNGVSVATRTGAAITVPALSSLWFGDAHDSVTTSGVAVASANGALDEVRVYSFEGTAALVNRDMEQTRICPVVTSFRLAHDGAGIHCLSEPVTATALASNGSTVTGYSGAITLDTQTGRGTWTSDATNAGAFADAVADDGLATYTFSASDLGTALFGLTYRSGATPLDVDVFETGSTATRDDDSEGSLAFGPSGFVVTAAALSNPPPATIDTVIPAQTAGTALSLYLTAYGTTATDPTCGVIETYTGAKNLGVWSPALDPTTLAAAVLVNGSAVGATSGAATPLAVAFTNGQASVTARHDDVGRIGVSLRDATVTTPAGGILGASAGFVVRPATFAITAITRADATGNPGASTPTGAIFVSAGTPFSVTVEARNAAGARTPSYGREADPEGIEVRSAALVAPVGGRNGSGGAGALASGAAFVPTTPAGTFRNTAVSFDEVGAVTLRAHVADATYLDAGDVLGTISANVGRFTPHHFAATVDPVAFATGCQTGRFTYTGKPLVFAPGLHPAVDVTAESLANTTTANYAGTWFRMTPATITPRTWTAQTGALDSTGPNAPRVTDLGSGLGTVSFDQGPAVAFVRSTPVAPFAAEIGLAVSVLDADGVAYAANPLPIGRPLAAQGIAFQDGNEIRFGRLAFENAHGAEVRALSVPLRAERFDGLRFVPNTADVCSDVPLAQLTQTLTPVALATTAAIANHPLVAGSAGLSLSAPGAGNTGSVVLGANLSAAGANLPWLRFDWNGDGTHLEDPAGRATFGIYEGSDAMVDVRERY